MREKVPRVEGTGAPHKPPRFIETDEGRVLVGSALPQDLAEKVPRGLMLPSRHAPIATVGWSSLEAALYRSGFWIRIFGRGIWFATYAGLPEVFSEREGYARVIRLGRWARLRWLRREAWFGPSPLRALERELELQEKVGELHFFGTEDPDNPDDVRRAVGRAEFLEERG